jgi:hypothetical protein
MRLSIISIVILCLISSCFKPADYENTDPSLLINITTNDTTVPADGAATAIIKARLSKDAAPDRRMVIFKTSLGTFQSGSGDSVKVEAKNTADGIIATAYLTSISEGEAVVKTSILGYEANQPMKVTFVRAYPEGIRVSVDSFAIHASYQSEVLITATVSTANGKASAGTLVNFEVRDDNNNLVGTYLNGRSSARTNQQGTASVRYSAGETNTRGRLTIQATTTKADGTDLPATTQLFLTD